jgi:hypothetical protein
VALGQHADERVELVDVTVDRPQPRSQRGPPDADDRVRVRLRRRRVRENAMFPNVFVKLSRRSPALKAIGAFSPPFSCRRPNVWSMN